jgi:hypothetical protein
MSDNSPVPEWFGRNEEERRAAKSARRRGLGCGLLVFFALLAAGAGYWAFDSHARANRLERDLAAARAREAARSTPPAVQPGDPLLPVEPTIPAEDPAEAGASDDEPVESGVALDASSVRQVIRSLSPAFRKCFDDALAEDPRSDGSLRVTVHIAPTGDVSSVETTRSGNLSPAVGSCVAAKVRGAKFPASGAPTSVSFPVTFAAQH